MYNKPTVFLRKTLGFISICNKKQLTKASHFCGAFCIGEKGYPII